MKSWTYRLKSIFSSCGGEMLVETIVSLLLLSIFLLTVTTIFNISLRMTVTSVQRATDTQTEIINPAILADYPDNGGYNIAFNNKATGEVLASHKIKLLLPDDNDSFGIVAFDPSE